MIEIELKLLQKVLEGYPYSLSKQGVFWVTFRFILGKGNGAGYNQNYEIKKYECFSKQIVAAEMLRN